VLPPDGIHRDAGLLLNGIFSGAFKMLPLLSIYLRIKSTVTLATLEWIRIISYATTSIKLPSDGIYREEKESTVEPSR
jgi:hypothetical protein